MAKGRVAATRKPSTSVINLNASRKHRAEAFAARRAERGEGADTSCPIVFGEGDQVIATLGPEFPLEWLAPVLAIEVDIPALVVQVMEALEQPDERDATIGAVVGVLVTNPNLPQELVEAVKAVGRNVLGDGGYELFVAERPSGPDVVALTVGILTWYGVSLGELWRSSQPPLDGGTSTPTSAAPTPGSTPAESGVAPESLAS